MSAIAYTDLVIIGAGPYGLAAAVHARRENLDFRVIGAPMAFWKSHMPSGMRLRTACDWQIADSLEKYLGEQGLPEKQPEPVGLEFFTDYITSAARSFDLPLIDSRVERLFFEQGYFKCRLANRDILCAPNVIVATGYYDYRFIPAEYRELFSAHHLSHTADTSDFDRLIGKRCLIIGGRQSAFEWAGLLKDFVSDVHVVCRHELPLFKRSDWSWVYPFIEKARGEPGWYRDLPASEKEAIHSRFWREGRLELEDWLQPGLDDRRVRIWSNTRITAVKPGSDGALTITLNDSATLTIDHVIAATGYLVDVRTLGFLRHGNILERLSLSNGFPKLDAFYQSSVPGLYFTGIHAVNDFGPFLYFVAGAFASAEVMIRHIRKKY
ncbi:MAG: NAD(P)/FAD-dependent oxidoreductase [Gammaproteobacteria bacterium]